MQRGETAVLKELAAELRPIFESGHVQPEALAAILLFQQAAEAEQVTRALLDQVRALSVGCRSIYKSTKAGELKSMRRRRILL
jgi:hypothetical protein